MTDPSPAAPGPRAAILWAVATAAVLAALAPFPGVSRTEAASSAASDRAAAFWTALPRDAAAAFRTALEAPPGADPDLAATLSAATHGALRFAGDVLSRRIATVLFAALLSAALALLGLELAGRAGALLAPVLFWAAPRALHHALAATPDLAAAALWIAAAVAWRRALSAERHPGWIGTAAVLFGLAAATRGPGWILLPLLLLHALAARLLATGPDRPSARAWTALGAMAVAGAVAVVAVAPWIVRDPARLLAPPPGPLDPLAPAWVTALAVPLPLLVVYAGGLLHACARLAGALRARREGASGTDAAGEALLLLLALAPAAAAAAGGARAGSVGPWLASFPVLAALGARALAAAARGVSVRWRVEALASLALLAVYPGVRAAAHHFPLEAASWNEIAGGAPGAASLRLARQEGGEAAREVLPALRERARPGARIWWAGVAPEAVEAYRRDGRLRDDLRAAADLAEADVAVVTADGDRRDAEYRVWAEFRTSRPVTAFHRDEVPLVHVYARPGGWR